MSIVSEAKYLLETIFYDIIIKNSKKEYKIC